MIVPDRRRPKMDWLLAIVRIAGVSSPLTAWLVQLQAEIDRAGAKALAERVRKLEDPISGLHPDVPQLVKAIYSAMTDEDEAHIWFDADFYNQFSKSLAVLEARGLIKGEHTIGHRYYDGLRVIDPSFIMYMCALCESDEQMKALIDRVESCERGRWLHGEDIKVELGLPMPVIRACFEIYESNGYGLCSQEIGPPKYAGRA